MYHRGQTKIELYYLLVNIDIKYEEGATQNREKFISICMYPKGYVYVIISIDYRCNVDMTYIDQIEIVYLILT